jgi:peptidyl-tRNA hydrolase, PTH2 family
MRSSRGSSTEVKMVLVVRGELRLTAGKMAAQVAHAAVMLSERAKSREPDLLEAWRQQGQKKIVLTVERLDDLERVDRAARARGLLTVWVDDAGLTEVPAGTRTVLGIGPARATEVDPVTGDLDLL